MASNHLIAHPTMNLEEEEEDMFDVRSEFFNDEHVNELCSNELAKEKADASVSRSQDFTDMFDVEEEEFTALKGKSADDFNRAQATVLNLIRQVRETRSKPMPP